MLNAYFAVLLSGLLWVLPFATYSQNADLLQKIPAEVLAQISPSQQQVIQDRVDTLLKEGKSEDEIVGILQSEGLIPASSSLDQKPDNPGSPDDPDILPPQAANAPAPVRAEEPAVILPVAATPKPSANQIFGQHIFNNAVQFNKALSEAPTFDYIVAPGDIFAVNVWGCS
ncbi:MAG: hypothetical protein AAFP02_21485, partial [Bacteroidota bacterium]